MGNNISKPTSLQVLKLNNNTPSHTHKILPFFHFITHVNQIPILTSSDIKEMQVLWSEQDLKLTIIDPRVNSVSDIIIPKQRNNESLGISVKFHEGLPFLLTMAVCETTVNSPAMRAGLINNQDYIVGVENVYLVDEDHFLNYLYKKIGSPVYLIVYNGGMESLRRVEVVPESGNLLGCELNSGILYGIPEGEVFFDFECDTTRKDLYKQIGRKVESLKTSETSDVGEVIQTNEKLTNPMLDKDFMSNYLDVEDNKKDTVVLNDICKVKDAETILKEEIFGNEISTILESKTDHNELENQDDKNICINEQPDCEINIINQDTHFMDLINNTNQKQEVINIEDLIDESVNTDVIHEAKYIELKDETENNVENYGFEDEDALETDNNVEKHDFENNISNSASVNALAMENNLETNNFDENFETTHFIDPLYSVDTIYDHKKDMCDSDYEKQLNLTNNEFDFSETNNCGIFINENQSESRNIDKSNTGFSDFEKYKIRDDEFLDLLNDEKTLISSEINNISKINKDESEYTLLPIENSEVVMTENKQTVIPDTEYPSELNESSGVVTENVTKYNNVDQVINSKGPASSHSSMKDKDMCTEMDDNHKEEKDNFYMNPTDSYISEKQDQMKTNNFSEHKKIRESPGFNFSFQDDPCNQNEVKTDTNNNLADLLSEPTGDFSFDDIFSGTNPDSIQFSNLHPSIINNDDHENKDIINGENISKNTFNEKKL